MEITLNHTIVPAKDRVKSAKWYEDILGFKFVKEWGHFAVLKINSTLAFDFMNQDEKISSHHYAFKVTDPQFDEIFNRIKERKIDYSSTPCGDGKFDHKILNTAISLQEKHKDKEVVLVSKDINLRLKAKALELNAEDYEAGKIKDVQKLYTGKTIIKLSYSQQVEELERKGKVDPAKLFSQLQEQESVKLIDNHFYILKVNRRSVLASFNPKSQKIELVEKTPGFNITPRNAEQTFAINALCNPEIKLVTIQGKAGTGKTLLALAAALEQRRNYRQIFVTSPIIPLSNKDMGFLPGNVKSKLDPYTFPKSTLIS